MKVQTLKSKLALAQNRQSNANAKKYIESLVTKFNKSNQDFQCELPDEILNDTEIIDLGVWGNGQGNQVIQVYLPAYRKTVS